jgi:hypothetical protein
LPGRAQFVLADPGAAGEFSNAVTWNSSMFQISCVLGPALGDFLLLGWGFPSSMPSTPFAPSSFSFVLPIEKIRRARRGSNTWRSLTEGIRFVLGRKVILATLTLDLFAVLLGGATTLLPIFADQICTVGRSGWAGCARRRRSALSSWRL